MPSALSRSPRHVLARRDDEARHLHRPPLLRRHDTALVDRPPHRLRQLASHKGAQPVRALQERLGRGRRHALIPVRCSKTSKGHGQCARAQATCSHRPSRSAAAASASSGGGASLTERRHRCTCASPNSSEQLRLLRPVRAPDEKRWSSRVVAKSRSRQPPRPVRTVVSLVQPPRVAERHPLHLHLVEQQPRLRESTRDHPRSPRDLHLAEQEATPS